MSHADPIVYGRSSASWKSPAHADQAPSPRPLAASAIST